MYNAIYYNIIIYIIYLYIIYNIYVSLHRESRSTDSLHDIIMYRQSLYQLSNSLCLTTYFLPGALTISGRDAFLQMFMIDSRVCKFGGLSLKVVNVQIIPPNE